MDARLEAAILDVLGRTAAGAAPDDVWLREAHPEHWREIRAFLAFQSRLAAGAPGSGRVGPYRLLQRLGRGGAGTVYLAECEESSGDAPAGTRVAVKVIHPRLAARPGFVERTLAEAHAARSLSHPNLARTLDAGVVDGTEGPLAYVVTEHVEGQNLRGLIEELGPLDEALVRHLGRAILSALVAIHRTGSLHGDLKPENVLIGPDETVKVADYGAVATPSAESPGASFRGTLLYAAPEQLAPGSGPADGRADLFALGVMIEELLSGAHPRDPRGARTPSRSDFLDAFAGNLRAESADARFASAADALAVLDAGTASSWWRERAETSRAERFEPWSQPGARATSLHGRDPELARLDALFGDATAGRGRAAIVVGEAGVGKSRLTEEAAVAMRARGATIVWVSLGRDVNGHAALAAALRGALGPERAARHAAAADAMGPALVAWIDSSAPPAAAARVTPESLPAALCALLASVARETPVVLVAEDLHDAAAVDVALVGRIAEELEASRVLVLATTRLAGADAARRALAAAETVELVNLGVEAVTALVADALRSDDLGDRLGPGVHRRADGNPLAVLETLDELRRAEKLVRDERGAWTLRGDVEAPAGSVTARAMLAHRLAALPRGDRDLLAAAACVGTRFDPALVARALGQDPGRLLLRLARLGRRDHLVRPSGDGLAFEHHEVRDAALGAVPEDRVRELHAKLALAMDDECAESGVASPSHAAAIVRHALAGADGPRASRHLDRVLNWLVGGGRVAECIELATAALGVAGAAEGRTRALVHARLGQAHAISSRHDLAQADYDHASREAAAVGDDALSLEARVLALEGRTDERNLDAAVAGMRELIADCVAAAVPSAEALARAALARIHRFQGRHPEAVAEARRIVELRMREPDECLRGEGLHLLACALADAGDWEEAIATNRDAVVHFRAGGAPLQPLVWARTVDATCLARLGRRSESMAAWEAGARMARSIGDTETECVCRTWFADHLRISGRRAESEPHHERAVALATRSGSANHEILARHHRALLRVADGRTAEALADEERCLELSSANGVVMQRMRALAVLAGLHGLWDDRRRAAALAEEAMTTAGGSGSSVIRGFALTLRGKWGGAGGGPDAAALREAVTLLCAGGNDDIAASARIESARIDARQGRLDDAVRGVRDARSALLRFDVPSRVIECDALLVAFGAEDPRAVAARLDGDWLTIDVFPRVAAAGLVAVRAGAPSLLERARADVEHCVAHAPSRFAAALRARLERDLDGGLG